MWPCNMLTLGWSIMPAPTTLWLVSQAPGHLLYLLIVMVGHLFGCWRSTCTIKLGIHVHFLSSLSSDLVACTILCLNTWSLVRLSWLLVFSVCQKDLVKDVTICRDVRMSAYKLRYLNNSEDPPDVGLSSEDEATGMEEITGIACRVTLSRPSPTQLASAPSTSQPTRSAMPPGDPSVPEGDKVVIKEAVLRGIKRGS